MLTQLGIAHLAALDHGIHQLHQEGAVDAQHTAMAGSAAQQAAQHIAAALVAGQHAVAHHKHGGTDMVGDHADGNIVVLILAILFARDLFHMMQHALHGIDLEQVAHALHYAGQALQAHAGINVGLCQALVVALAVGIELAEHQVPDLHVAVAVTAHMAIGLAAAELGAAVKINFRAGAAGAGAMLPEVIFLAKANHVVGRNANLLGPDIVSLIVLFVNRNEQLILGNGHPVIGGQKFPCPGDHFFFKVILKAEVAQHFKKGAVAGSDAHILNVRGADALLAGGHAVAGGLFLAKEPLFHGGHAAVDQQQAGVVFRHQGKAAQAQVIFLLKEGQILLAKFVQTSPFHCCLLL